MWLFCLKYSIISVLLFTWQLIKFTACSIAYYQQKWLWILENSNGKTFTVTAIKFSFPVVLELRENAAWFKILATWEKKKVVQYFAIFVENNRLILITTNRCHVRLINWRLLLKLDMSTSLGDLIAWIFLTSPSFS